MHRVKPFEESPLPSEGPALIVCDYTSLGDPLLLLATAGRPVWLVFNGGRDLFSTTYPVGVSGDSLYSGSTRQTGFSCDSHDVGWLGRAGGHRTVSRRRLGPALGG